MKASLFQLVFLFCFHFTLSKTNTHIDCAPHIHSVSLAPIPSLYLNNSFSVFFFFKVAFARILWASTMANFHVRLHMEVCFIIQLVSCLLAYRIVDWIVCFDAIYFELISTQPHTHTDEKIEANSDEMIGIESRIRGWVRPDREKANGFSVCVNVVTVRSVNLHSD